MGRRTVARCESPNGGNDTNISRFSALHKSRLDLWANLREAEAQSALRPEWPIAVRATMEDVGRDLMDLADRIQYTPSDILSEIAPTESKLVTSSAPEWDAFISHASEDKDGFVEPLARELRSHGLKIWYDNFNLTVGDSLRRSIDRGLAHSKYGVVILSPSFFAKEWPKKELDGLVTREVDGHKVILPVWHEIDAVGIRSYSPMLADRVAVPSSKGVVAVAQALLAGMGATEHGSAPRKPTRDTAPSPRSVPLLVTSADGLITVSGHVESSEARALERFNYLRQTRIDNNKSDPFQRGHWQASFALQGHLRDLSLPELLEVLHASKTNRTGWDVGHLPTREGFAPYPFHDGIEVWLVDDAEKGSPHSEFWRAEKVGTFSLFRGYQEDEADFAQRHPKIQLDYSLLLWRVSEFLLYLESFAKNLGAGPLSANIRIRWTGLNNRRLGNYDLKFGSGMSQERICRQPSVDSTFHIVSTSVVKRTLIRDVQAITRPLFEVFDFFALSEEQVKLLVQKLFDADT